MFKNNFSLNFHRIDASEQFLSELKGVTDPEQKRKIVGEEFIQVFTEFMIAVSLGDAKYSLA